MERISSRTNDSSDFPPPPPYATVVYKVDDYDFDRNPPPNYSDLDGQSIVYINNYPGPPLTDGQVQMTRDHLSMNPENIISRKICIYVLLNGFLTVLFGIVAVGLEIAILATNSIIYYYFGFWGGALLLGSGISTIVLYNRRYRIDYTRLFHSFFWQAMVAAIVFGIGIIIVIVDKCNDDGTEDNSTDHQCKHSYKILNGFLLGIVGVALLQSIINTTIFGILKRRHSRVLNALSS